MDELETQFDFTDFNAVKEILNQNNERHKMIVDYTDEYKGTDRGRKLRRTQIGFRENYVQGNKMIEAERLKIQYQKKIVRTAVSFLFGEPPTINANDTENQNAEKILNVIKKNRIHNKLINFAESVMSTTIGVFIFSKVDGEIKARVYTEKNGRYTPQYDMYGDLIAFYWEFDLGDDTHLWIFTDELIYKYKNDRIEGMEYHGFGVIPVVFVDQEEPEWWEVKEMIDRLEMLASKLSGSNNYFAFPILKMKGALGVRNGDQEDSETLIDISEDGKSLLLGFAEKNNQVVEADAEFMQRDTGVDSIELERKMLQEFIHSISQTPDLSFEKVKGIGAVSGRALLLMLQDPINKTKLKRGDYETAIKRIISVIKSGLGINDDNLEFDVEFNLSIPEDLKETIDMLYSATGGRPTMSQETAIQNNPMVKDPALEKEKIDQERSLNIGENYLFQ